ncbi:uncharacterized protein LOC118438289 [Folsomia candida]|uniref:uncharacterized protein LOC118438289 n=1 Tax=Folsomia candida TaxID=158441 RepID=UPI001604E23B|nr:uncharacterized protein LOC118438289 [Folsomia candida]
MGERPVRTTAGLLPRRYCDNDAPNVNVTTPPAVDSPASIVTGSGSRKSSSIVRSQKRIDVETRTALAVVDKAQLARRKDFALMEAQQQSIERKIQKLVDLCADPDLSPEQVANLVSQRKGLESDLEESTEDLARAKVLVQFDEESAELQKREILIRADAELNKLENDSDAEDVERESEPVDKSNLTLMWTHQLQEIRSTPITSPFLSQEEQAHFFPLSSPVTTISHTSGQPTVTTWTSHVPQSVPVTTTAAATAHQMSASSSSTTTTAAMLNPLFATFAKPYITSSQDYWATLTSTQPPVSTPHSFFAATQPPLSISHTTAAAVPPPNIPTFTAATHTTTPLVTMASWSSPGNPPPTTVPTSYIVSAAPPPPSNIPPIVTSAQTTPFVSASSGSTSNPPPHAHHYWTAPHFTPVSMPYSAAPPPPPLHNPHVPTLPNFQPTSSSTDKILARQVQGRDLPVFTGRPEEWGTFYVAFVNSTNFCQFSPAENLIRLQRCLKGEALKIVQSLLVSPANVPAVMQRLQRRFGRPDQIIQNLIRKVQELPPVKIEKLDTLVDLGIAVDDLAANITSLNCMQHLHNPMLIKELEDKLPSVIKLEWGRHFQLSGHPVPTVDLFAEWLNHYSDAAWAFCPPKVSNESNHHERKRRNLHDRVMVAEEEKKKTRDDHRENRPRHAKPPEKCPCCRSNNHKLHACRDFADKPTDERWELVKNCHLCFRCLSSGHAVKDCKFPRACGIDGCQKPHHKLLHVAAPRRRLADDPENPRRSAAVPPEMVNTGEEMPYINLMVLPVTLEGPTGSISTFMMLDCGSTLTVIESTIAEAIGLKGESRQITVGGFQSDPTVLNTKVVSLRIKSKDGSYVHDLNNVKTVDRLRLREQSVRKSLLKKWPHLQGIDLNTYDCKRPGILVGMDNPTLFLQKDFRVGKGNSSNSPIAIRTPLGWALMGRTAWAGREQYAYHMQEVDPLHQLVKDQFSTESFGVKPLVDKPRTKEDKRAQEILDASTRRVEGGWETALLWRDDHVKLPESYSNAYRRLMSMERKMDRDPEFMKSYCNKIEEYLSKGYARILSPEEAATTTNKTNYVPHFMAYNPKKPGKLRFVFDAAAKNHGRSLNDHILQGPDKLIPLPNILLKFRQRQIALTADIEDMFHRVKVKPEDAQAQRFLWRGSDHTRPPDTLEMGVLIFGATCSPTCAQEAKNKNAAEFQQQFPDAVDAIINRHYVDDLLDSCDTVEQAKKRFAEVRTIHAAGGFNLRNWLSNSPEVVAHIPEELRASNMKDLQMGEDNVIERVLGLFWRPESDVFTFSLNFVKARVEILSGKKVPTKREMLSLVMSIYDPLGFLVILTIKAKILLQQAWRSEVGWDDEIPRSTFESWRTWLQEVQKIPTFRLPRCYSWTFTSADEVQLHIFVDASEEAFGAVGYFRIHKEEKVEIALVMGKAKVAPLKSLSIPRMELQAALMGVRLAHTISEQHEVKIDRTIFWSDNTTVLGWIRSDGRKYVQFVANRVGEIQELSTPEQWRWVPALENVADELTRLESPCDFQPTSRWVNGPPFLQQSEENWPVPTCSRIKESPEEEMKTHCVLHFHETAPVIDISRFSLWRRLINTTAYVFRVRDRVKNKFPLYNKELCPEELVRAQEWWWRTSQQQSFPNEWECLSAELPLPKKSKLSKLCPYMDKEGVLRARGRIDNAAQVDVAMRRPVILDARHPYTRLLIAHFHRQCGHHGTERILNEIRQQFYIVHLRPAVKNAQQNCQICKNYKAKPSPPEMGQLPAARLDSHVIPFHRTGLDYFGPIEVNVKRSREKRYGALFTCLVTRAVHLELAHSLSTDSCIMAIRKFVGRRGCPVHIYSDNGTNFRGADNELKTALQEINQKQMENECATRGITWHWNPPSAPHFGGSWERLVRSVKTALGKVLLQRNLKDESLYTLLVEAEHVVNSHPLTHVSIDPDDPEALTPNHFLLGRSSNLQPAGEFSPTDLTSHRQWRATQELANQFWRRWVIEYLPTLLRREKWDRPTNPIEEGDVVVEVNESLDRNQWPLGMVVKTFPGSDGIPRVVDIRMSNGKQYRRPVAKLCVLDVRAKTAKPNAQLDSLSGIRHSY